MQRALAGILRQNRRKPAAPAASCRSTPMGFKNLWFPWSAIHQGFLSLGAILSCYGSWVESMGQRLETRVARIKLSGPKRLTKFDESVFGLGNNRRRWWWAG